MEFVAQRIEVLLWQHGWLFNCRPQVLTWIFYGFVTLVTKSIKSFVVGSWRNFLLWTCCPMGDCPHPRLTVQCPASLPSSNHCAKTGHFVWRLFVRALSEGLVARVGNIEQRQLEWDAYQLKSVEPTFGFSLMVIGRFSASAEHL